MLILLIAFINIGIYVIFFITLIKALKLVKLHLGFGHALILVIGLFALISNKSAAPANFKPYLHVQLSAPPDLRDLHNSEYLVEKNIFHQIDLSLRIGKIKETDSLVVSSATAYMNGMHIGTTWEPKDIRLFPVPGSDSIRYMIEAQLSNRVPIFFSNDDWKAYTGTIALR